MHDIRQSFVQGEGLRRPSLIAQKNKKPEAKGPSLTSVSVARTATRMTDSRREGSASRPCRRRHRSLPRKKHEVKVVNLSSLGRDDRGGRDRSAHRRTAPHPVCRL
jgi:hypothetical protein